MKRRTFIKTMIIGSGAFLFKPKELFSSVSDKNIYLLMVFNNIGGSNNFRNKWGLSIWIEDKDSAVLFDTGGDGSILWSNIQKSMIKINKLSKIIISHNHSDHTNGLPFNLKKTNYKPVVFVPDYELKNFKHKNPEAKIIGIKDPTEINSFLWSTGQLSGLHRTKTIFEQSIIIIKDDCIYLFTGCAHPGIVEIAERTKKIFPNKKIDLVGGGFHLNKYSIDELKTISMKLKKFHIRNIAPSHCTGNRAIDFFKDDWGDNFINFNNGDSLKI